MVKIIAVAAVIFILTLGATDLSYARQKSRELQSNGLCLSKRLPGIRLAANEPVALPVRELRAKPGASIFLNLSSPKKDVKFVVFRKVPPDVKFSRGFLADKNWFVSMDDLSKTTLTCAPGAGSPLSFEVLYFRNNKQKPVARGLIVVRLNESVMVGEEAAEDERRDLPAVSVASAKIDDGGDFPANMPQIHTDQENADLGQATEFLRKGDISSARRILEFLASQGSAKGARALAETYDPAYLQRLTTAGLQPNIEYARKWYKRAAELGDREALSRLSGLNGH